MMLRMTVISLAAIMLLSLTALPGFAFGGVDVGSAGLGAGFMFPDINYYHDSDFDGWMLHGDYLYPLSQVLNSEAYVGLGYSYVFGNSDYLGDENGINICLGFNLQKNIDIRGRYLFLGGGDRILSAGATMYF
jgi:hypothetical protein